MQPYGISPGTGDMYDELVWTPGPRRTEKRRSREYVRDQTKKLRREGRKRARRQARREMSGW